MRKTLSKLKSLHPLPDDLEEIKKYGFNADIGGESKWITDGHAIFCRYGFDMSFIGSTSKQPKIKPKPQSIAAMWAEAEGREDIPVSILGSIDREYSSDPYDDDIAPTELAILRDDLDRIIFAHAFKLSFMLYALKPDALSVAKDGGDLKWIQFWRNGWLVGCLMPMRNNGIDYSPESGYDLDGAPLPLKIVLDDEVEK